MRARFKSTCQACRRRILPGDPIKVGWGYCVHEACYQARPPAKKFTDKVERLLERAEKAGFR